MKKMLLSLVALATMGLAAMAQGYSVDPAANTVLPKVYSNYATMSFTFNFDQAVSVGDVTSVKLMKDDPVTGTVITPDDDWYANTSNGGKTVTIWGSDYDGFTCYFACEDANYYLVVPAGVLTEDEIVIEYYGMNAPAPSDPLEVVGGTPEPNSVLPQTSNRMVNMTFNLEFNQMLTSVDASGVTLREEDPENGFNIEPMSEWVATISGDKMSVNLWGSDYDGYTDYFFARDIAYYLTIPAGAITTGRAVNEEAIVITYYGAEPLTGIDNVNAKGATEVARYNLNGQRVTAGQTGVVIVKMSDGSSVKMIVR